MEKKQGFMARFNASPFGRGLKWTYQTLLFLSGLFLLLAIIAMVLMRYVFKMNLFGIDEIILTVVMWFYFFGGINGSMEDSHIRADLVSFFVKDTKVIHYLRLFTRLIEICVMVFLIVLSYQLLVTNFQRMPVTQGLKIPYVVPQFAIFIGYILMLVYNVGHFVDSLLAGPAAPDTDAGDLAE